MTLSDYILPLLPEWILLIGACLVMVAGVGRQAGDGAMARSLASAVVAAALAATAWLAIQAPAEVQIPGLVLDDFVHYVRFGGLGVGLLILLCNLHVPASAERGEFLAMILFSLAGLLLTAAANDLAVLFLAIELVSVPTYVLVSLSRNDIRASEAGVKYFFLGAMAAALMLYGFSFLYGTLGGRTTMLPSAGAESMVSFLASTGGPGTYAVIGLLLALSGVFFKMAAVPFHVYAPDVYEGAASPITGLLGFVPKFAGFVAAAKLLAVFGWNAPQAVMWLLWVVAALTMTVGNTLALWQTNVKRILAYSSIAHTGYMLIGLLVGPVAGQGPMRDGVAAMLFYIVVYGAMNLGAFAVLAALSHEGRSVEQLRDLEGLSAKRPGLALALAICIFSLMGFPPTAGLLGKVYIFSSAFSVGSEHAFGKPLVILAIIGVINSAIGAAYYLRIVAAAYIRTPHASGGPEWQSVSKLLVEPTGGPALRAALALCSLTMLAAFLWPVRIVDGARRATVALTIEHVDNWMAHAPSEPRP